MKYNLKKELKYKELYDKLLAICDKACKKLSLAETKAILENFFTYYENGTYRKSLAFKVSWHDSLDVAISNIAQYMSSLFLEKDSELLLLEELEKHLSNQPYLPVDVSSKYIEQNNEIKKLKKKLTLLELTGRELQVLRGLAEGKECKELAQEFSISLKTIYRHRERVLRKLKLRNNVEVFRYALKYNLLKAL